MESLEMEPLETCCNGCDSPPEPPSRVLCVYCLEALDRKMHELKDLFEEPLKEHSS